MIGMVEDVHESLMAELCKEFTVTFDAYTAEITEHKIRENLAKFKGQLPSVKDYNKRKKLKAKIAEYERHMATYDESKKVYDILCNDLKATVNCKTLVDAKVVWTEEIIKYDIFIKLGRLQEKYREILISYDDVLDEFCFV